MKGTTGNKNHGVLNQQSGSYFPWTSKVHGAGAVGIHAGGWQPDFAPDAWACVTDLRITFNMDAFSKYLVHGLLCTPTT